MSRIAVTPARRIAVALAGTVTLAVSTSACQAFNPMQTQVAAVVGDGTSTTVGTVHAQNLVVVVPSSGSTAALSGYVVNTGSSDAKVTFLSQADSSKLSGSAPAATMTNTVSIGAGQSKTLSGVNVTPTDAPVGSMTSVVISLGDGTTGQVSVPVLPANGYYSTHTPAPMPSTTSAPSTSAPGASATSTSGAGTSAASPAAATSSAG